MFNVINHLDLSGVPFPRFKRLCLRSPIQKTSCLCLGNVKWTVFTQSLNSVRDKGLYNVSSYFLSRSGWHARLWPAHRELRGLLVKDASTGGLEEFVRSYKSRDSGLDSSLSFNTHINNRLAKVKARRGFRHRNKASFEK